MTEIASPEDGHVMISNKDQHICLSGGADGADLQWGMCAGRAGHFVVHWSFKGHRSQAPEIEIAILTEEQLGEADEKLTVANYTLKRNYPPRNVFVHNLFRRNWYQVKDAQRVYAVSTIVRGLVQGGTSWAVQMFIDRHEGEPCEVYVFDQEQEKWFTWNGAMWTVITSPPEPHGVWAGIGSRNLNHAGKNEIRRLLKYSPPGK